MKKEIKNIVFCAMYIALGVTIANVLHWASPGIGRVLSPMHFTVIIAGLMLGWKYGLVAGILTPLISAIFGMPPFFPTGVCMALECGVYGLVAGLLTSKLVIMKDEKFNFVNIIIILVIAMVAGRLVGGLFNAVYLGIKPDASYTFKAFLNSYIVVQLPSIILQFILIPMIVTPLKKLEGNNKIEESKESEN